MTRQRWRCRVGLLALAATTVGICVLPFGVPAARAQGPAQTTAQTTAPVPTLPGGLLGGDEPLSEELRAGLADAGLRLPVAAALGTLLALRPRRGPAPPRDPAVVETQIVLAIVGALIMLIVGASLARAFGIAGAANLIRYRAKIEDPKDAVVMLSALAVGLASGVGLLGIAAGSTGFLVLILWVIEGFEHRRVRSFLLTIKLGERTPEKRLRIERLLRSAKTTYELRTTADDELTYLVSAREGTPKERLSGAISALAANGKAEVEWKEEPKVRPLPEKERE